MVNIDFCISTMCYFQGDPAFYLEVVLTFHFLLIMISHNMLYDQYNLLEILHNLFFLVILMPFWNFINFDHRCVKTWQETIMLRQKVSWPATLSHASVFPKAFAQIKKQIQLYSPPGVGLTESSVSGKAEEFCTSPTTRPWTSEGDLFRTKSIVYGQLSSILTSQYSIKFNL